MIATFLPSVRNWVDTQFVEELKAFDWHPSLAESARHVLVGGGKALRPACLVWAYADLVGASSKPPHFVMQWATALEMIHTYSLVHDDLPAMDNDDYRRGRPTLHVLKNEAEAILAGDALLTGAFELVARSSAGAIERAEATLELARAAGGAGMIAGQVRDMQAERAPLTSADALKQVHNEKTGALFGCAFALARIAAGRGGRDASIDMLRAWGVELGLLFQIVDDVLDAVSSRAELGKSAGKDAHAQKSTYVSLLGVDGARRAARELAEKLKLDARAWMTDAESGADLIDYFTERTH